MLGLKPFWRYYGGKWRAAPRYPRPLFDTIIEPFAGVAGYSLRYYTRKIILVEKYDIIAELWRYLIAVRSSEIEGLPIVEDVRDLPESTPIGARSLIGFHMNAATTTPCLKLSAGLRRNRSSGADRNGGWSEATRHRIASQVGCIKHWRIIEGDYSAAPDLIASWSVDPPYANAAGRRYVHSDLDRSALAGWCRSRGGQVIVRENAGASWLPFRPFARFRSGLNGFGSNEVFWSNQ